MTRRPSDPLAVMHHLACAAAIGCRLLALGADAIAAATAPAPDRIPAWVVRSAR